MSDALWAARQGDALAHNSMLADAFGGVLAVAAGVAVGAAVGAAIVGAAGLTVATGGLGACLLGAAVNVAVGVGMNLSGADASISQLCDDLANNLFPPSVCAHINTGSSNVFINGLPAARAAGAVPAAGAAGVELPEDEPPQDSFLDIAKGFFSELWQPAVASPAPGAVPKGLDQVTCERHAPMPVQYIAEGSDRVFINGQPAVRSGDRSTCEATVVGSGQISSNVRIGGGQQVVRPIRSSKPPGVGLAVNALMMLKGGPRRFTSNLPCMLLGSVNAYGVSQVTGALSRAISGSPHPVHAATGAKVLGGEEDLDFALPGLMPIEWQRFYNSRDTRRDGLFGAGWSVPFEVSVHIEHGPEGGDRLVYIDEQARRIDMGLIAPGTAAFSPGEGLAVRRHEDGRVLIESEDGIYRLFEASLRDPTLLRLAQICDRNDNRLHLQYDASERLIALHDSLNVLRLNLVYSSQWPGRVEYIERLLADDTRELLASYAYDICGDLIEVRDGAGNVLRRFAYDSGQRMVEHQLPSGLRCFYDWALIEGREWRVVGHHTDYGERYRFQYDLDQGSTVVTDGLNRRSTRRWNPQHQITEYSDALGHTWRFHWNEERQLLGATDPQGGQWRYTYDGAGNLESSEDPLGQCELTLWLEHWSLPKTQTDAAGHSWQYRYDARGNCTHAVDPLGHVTRYHYNEFGQVIEIIDPSGKSRVQHWNALGQLVEQIDCSGYSTSFTYDPRGFLHTVTDALGERTLYLHDRYGRLLSSRTPDERLSEYQRNPSGQLTTFTDPAGAATRYSYDRRGQLRLRTDALRRQVQFSYDAYGRLQTLTNENGESYRFAWDSADRLVVQQGLDGSQHHYRYDALNNPIRVEQRPAPGIGAPLEDAIVHELERDALGRLTAKVTRDGRTEYRYDPLDQLTALAFTDHDGQSQELGFSYDAVGQLLSEQTASATLQHHYDELGNLIQTQYPDGRWLNRLYYGSGHLHQINLDGQLISDFERDRLHREVLRTQGPIITRTRYDRSGRLRSRIQRIADQSSPVRVKEYDYDPADNLVTRLSQADSRKSRSQLHYDATARLIAGEDELARHTETFAYDAAANLLDTARIHSGGVRHNHLTHYQDKRYRYDGFGRLREKHSLKHGTQRFEYDAESRLIAVRNPNGDVIRMSYDPLGRRIAKRACNRHDQLISETRFTWDGLRLLQEETHQRQCLYVYADHSHEPLARVDTRGEIQTVHYFHNHPNGQPEELTDKNGTSVWSAHYQVWGNTLSEEHDTSIEAQNLRFQGQYLDRETGLHYNTFRFYDPDIGRFTTPDPIGLAGGLNLYQYAPNPVGWVDPLGWKPCFRDTKAQHHAETIITKHGGVVVAENRYRMPNRRAARQAASEIAGNLGSKPVPIAKADFRGGPPSWRNSQAKIGMKNQSDTSGWRDDSPGHPQLGAGPHVNAWNNEKGITSNLHLDY